MVAEARRALIVMGGKGLKLSQQNQAGTGARDGHAFNNAGAKLLEHAQLIKQLSLNGRLAAGKYQTVKVLLQISRLPQLNTARAQLDSLASCSAKAPWTASTATVWSA